MYRLRNFAVVLVLIVLSALSLQARSDVIRFSGVLVRVETGKIVVRIATAEIPLTVNSSTIIETAGDHLLTVEDLMTGQFLRVEAAFTAEGLFAKSIDVEKHPENHFRIDGLVETVEAVLAEVKITIIGVPIWITSETKIHSVGRDPLGLKASDLKVGDRADAQGTQQGNRLVAKRLTVGFPKGEDRPIRFEGIIEAITEDGKKLELKVGDVGRAFVLIDSNTKVIGTPKVDGLAEVTGFLQSDLSVLALRVKIDQNGNGNVDDDEDDDRNPNAAVRVEIELEPPAGTDSEAEGSAAILYNTQEEFFWVKAEDLEKSTEYQVKVTSKTGSHTFTLQSNPGGHISLFTKAPFPGTLGSVKDFTKVEILKGTTLVLSGSFQE